MTAVRASVASLYAASQSKEEIDIASFRPRPRVGVLSVIAREKPPYWLGWPGTSYDVEGERARYSRAIAEAGTRVGVEIIQEGRPLEEILTEWRVGVEEFRSQRAKYLLYE